MDLWKLLQHPPVPAAVLAAPVTPHLRAARGDLILSGQSSYIQEWPVVLHVPVERDTRRGSRDSCQKLCRIPGSEQLQERVRLSGHHGSSVTLFIRGNGPCPVSLLVQKDGPANCDVQARPLRTRCPCPLTPNGEAKSIGALIPPHVVELGH
uniref:Uncharacterized protein n=1 Tax=Molossus molossus TaxID=27622 RepID=A0A7J8BN37_MOLMO|nr:hypothetical protein HJG59_010106 [Molossus molossus]